MARLNNDVNTTRPKAPNNINIAGDFAENDLEIAPIENAQNADDLGFAPNDGVNGMDIAPVDGGTGAQVIDRSAFQSSAVDLEKPGDLEAPSQRRTAGGQATLLGGADREARNVPRDEATGGKKLESPVVNFPVDE